MVKNLDMVSLIGCKSYEADALGEVIERHFGLIDPEGTLIKPGDRVVVKPNLLMGKSPEEAVTTHPAFIAAIVRAVKRRGGDAADSRKPQRTVCEAKSESRL